MIYNKMYADNFKLCTRETHKQHCNQLKGPLYDHIATTYGLTRDSILNTSKLFHIVYGLVPDVMHRAVYNMKIKNY